MKRNKIEEIRKINPLCGDWYICGRTHIDIPWRLPDRSWVPNTQILACPELVSDIYIFIERLIDPNPTLEKLKSLFEDGFNSCGLPKKGIILDSSLWASFDKNKKLKPNYNSEPFEQAPFNGLSLIDKIELEKWFASKNISCSFTYGVLDEKPLIDALASETVISI